MTEALIGKTVKTASLDEDGSELELEFTDGTKAVVWATSGINAEVRLTINTPEPGSRR